MIKFYEYYLLSALPYFLSLSPAEYICSRFLRCNKATKKSVEGKSYLQWVEEVVESAVSLYALVCCIFPLQQLPLFWNILVKLVYFVITKTKETITQLISYMFRELSKVLFQGGWNDFWTIAWGHQADDNSSICHPWPWGQHPWNNWFITWSNMGVKTINLAWKLSHNLEFM